MVLDVDRLSPLERLALLPDDELHLRLAAAGGPEAVLRDWRWLARPAQREPAGDWREWVILSGRGFGKTRAGAEWVCDRIEGGARRVALIGRRHVDVLDVMIRGESGLVSVAERRGLPVRLTMSPRIVVHVGDAHVIGVTAQEPDELRGPELDTIWGDEVAAWPDRRDQVGVGVVDNALLALRAARDGRALWTTTPRPVPIVRDWLRRVEAGDPSIVLTRGSTLENAANLPADYLADLLGRWQGTRLADQEIEGRLVELGGGMIDPTSIRVTSRWGGRNVCRVRGWDWATTRVSDENADPDWLACALVAFDPDATVDVAGVAVRGAWCIEEVRRWRVDAQEALSVVARVARSDAEVLGAAVRWVIEEEPGSQSRLATSMITAEVRRAGLRHVEARRPREDKVTRAEVWAAAVEQGRVCRLAGGWWESFAAEVGVFPGGDHDDQVDAVSAAVDALSRWAPAGRGGLRG
jgi:predicted phage terminase large subunit-like protein